MGHRVSLQSGMADDSHRLGQMSAETCPFCQPDEQRIFFRSGLVLGLWDGFPVSRGHALLVTRRHVADWFDATADEQQALTSAIAEVKREIDKVHRPDGYNVGFNAGEAAGQTVLHLHIHVIPRYVGDTPEPRGGVRGVIPGKAGY